jgi:hypothetical protein
MDVVSFETAKKLKEAGFPQPEPAFGQVWYKSAGSPIIVTSGWEAGFAFVGPRSAMTQTTYMKRFQEQNGVFAPTATDILRHIHLNELIYYDDELGFALGGGIGDFDHNPAEVCAEAYISGF